MVKPFAFANSTTLRTSSVLFGYTTAAGSTSGTFLFYDDMWGGPFNSLYYNFRNGNFHLYLFGGDKDNGVSLDIAVARVPEPASLALMAAGLLYLGTQRRCRRRAA